mmetsp:Transcript_15763/g.43065  ORF Transcript_15763/g.43065 Transcript_15763/m.43065 type:complete len:235 (-) Transcript_15763:142-846(-)
MSRPGDLEDHFALLEAAGALETILLYLGARDLCLFSGVDSRRGTLELTDSAWCKLCEIVWSSKSSRYHLTPQRARLLALQGGGWRGHYKQALEDGRRDSLRPNELSELQWIFNFTPQAGGLGAATMQFVRFGAKELDSPMGLLLMKNYPPLPYELGRDGKVLNIANFPPHLVRRLDSWEWEITNENVIFVSCDDGVISAARSDLSVAVVHILEQTGGTITQADGEELHENESQT